LIDQIRAALKRNFYPLFVAEGESKQKLEQIQHSEYLNRAFRSFANIGGNLFIFGHSMSDSDNHILNLLTKNNVEAVYVSLHGEPNNTSNRTVIKKIETLAAARKRRRFKSTILMR
jgi:hypothetical protein